MGCFEKSYFPSNISSADIFGLIFEGCSKFRVIFSCGRSLHQRCMGKFGGVVHNPEIRCVFCLSFYRFLRPVDPMHIWWNHLVFDIMLLEVCSE